MIYHLAIIGGGPAGVAAGVYAARKKIKTIFLTADFQSQSAVSPDIQNWIGTISIPGSTLVENFRSHLLAYSKDTLDLKEGVYVKSVKKDGEIFSIETDSGIFQAKAVLIATGSTRRKLEISGAEEFDNKGLTYCATCDGPLFENQDVAVIGGGNAAFETAAQLLAYAKSVTLLNRSNTFKADEVTVEKVLAHPKMKAIKNAIPVEVLGDKFVNGLVYKEQNTGEEKTLPVTGIFVEIGLLPNTQFVGNLLEKNEIGQIKVDPRTQRTSVKGIWSAGDCSDGLYHQNNIAAGDAVKALEDIHMYIMTGK